MSVSILSKLYDTCRDLVDLRALHCSFIPIGDFVFDVEGIVSNLAKGSLNALSGLSMFTLVFQCIFPAWPMGVSGFCSSDFGFLRD